MQSRLADFAKTALWSKQAAATVQEAKLSDLALSLNAPLSAHMSPQSADRRRDKFISTLRGHSRQAELITELETARASATKSLTDIVGDKAADNGWALGEPRQTPAYLGGNNAFDLLVSHSAMCRFRSDHRRLRLPDVPDLSELLDHVYDRTASSGRTDSAYEMGDVASWSEELPRRREQFTSSWLAFNEELQSRLDTKGD